MALIKCSECGKEISDKAKACIHCGCPISGAAQKSAAEAPVQTNSAADRETGSAARTFRKKIFRGAVISLVMLGLFVLGVLAALICSALHIESAAVTAVISAVVVLCLYPAIYALIRIPFYIRLVKNVKHLEQRNLLGKAYLESKSGQLVAFGDSATLSEHFLHGSALGIPIPCDEILWVYIFESRAYGSFKIGTKHFGIVNCSGCSKPVNYEHQVEIAFRELQKRTGSLMIGNTAENKAKYKQLAHTK